MDLNKLIDMAEQRMTEEANAENWDNVRYWVGYCDGVKRVKKLMEGMRCTD